MKKVKVIFDDGSVADIDEADFAEAEKAGAKRHVPNKAKSLVSFEDGSMAEIMGVKHKTLAVEGVQFHPESILSEHGHAMLRNFLTLGAST